MNTQNFHLNFIFLCDDAFKGENGKVSIIGIFQQVNLREIPGKLLKSVLVGNFTDLSKTAEELELKVSLLDVENKPANLNIPAVKLPSSGGKDVGFFLELGNLEFSKTGDYKFVVEVNGELLGEYKFQVALVN
jgi:hypothetical protein